MLSTIIIRRGRVILARSYESRSATIARAALTR